MVVAGGGCAPFGYVFFGQLLSFLFSHQRSFHFSTWDMCLRIRGCPVVLDTELSLSVWHLIQKTRVLLRAWRLLLTIVAASGGVRHKFPNYMQRD